MKRIVTLIALAPGAALAHGGHAPLPEAAHVSAHGLIVGVAAIAAAALLALWRARDEG